MSAGRVYHCFAILKNHQCASPQDEEEPPGDEPRYNDAIPISVKRLKLKSTLEDAKLIALYTGNGKTITVKNGEFKRPTGVEHLFAIYSIESPVKFLKFRWTIYPPGQKPQRYSYGPKQ